MKNLEEKYHQGIRFLKDKGYYDNIVEEVYFLVKYIHPQMFVRLLSENLFNDMRGVFGVFVREDLRRIYQELQEGKGMPLESYLKDDYMNLIILHKCATSLEYQVKSIARMPEVKQLRLKSRYLETVSRKLNGEIQKYYRDLAENYKAYFRHKFSGKSSRNDMISVQCIENLAKEYDEYFLIAITHFQELSLAIHFLKDFFKTEIESKIVNQLALIYDQQEKMSKLIQYFINDLKRTFIHILFKNSKKGNSFSWINKALEDFIEGERFGDMLRRVIYQTLSLMQDKKLYSNVS